MTVTIEKIKELREQTGVGMAKCKEALEKAGGDIVEAVKLLRAAGMASATKKQERETKEGAIFFASNDSLFAFVEVCAETDFVVKNERFKEFGNDVAAELLAIGNNIDLDGFMTHASIKDPSLTIEDLRALSVQLLGENIQIRKISILPKKENHSYGVYSHMGGKIVAMAELSPAGFDAPAKDVAMHVAAFSPEYATPEHVPQEIIEREQEIAKSQIKDKPDFVAEKIITGKVRAYCEQVCLSCQKFVKDQTVSVEAFLQTQNKDLKVSSFLRWTIGQE